ncbi:hypothetical protein Pla52n_37030 [Stieleria varia]|uniref:Uncharacterized protein n=1 Tax=Stieleria varia TaxID=2528005 RepID=A0A5C6AUB8_9BACT|nr:hypothetical protein Pla52n_37030 [Stieleria varia]
MTPNAVGTRQILISSTANLFREMISRFRDLVVWDNLSLG